jgi:NAD(P)-dependent dehydrogenase (short-subunit alcohol dehydrogenase family)
MINYMFKFSLKGKVAFITGGAGLIGEAVSKALVSAGAKTIILDTDRKKSDRIRKEINRNSLKAYYEYFDITDIENISASLSRLIKRYKSADIWINSAYPRTKDWNTLIERLDVNSFRKNVDMHLNGYFFCCQKIAEYMKQQKSGSIINFASTYGMVGPDFSVYNGTKMTMPAAYSAIKGGIINFTKYLASYYGKYNIRVNCISPGGIYNQQPKAFVKRYIKKTPLGRMADKEDITGAVIYLASEAGAYVTGHNLIIDGGLTVI